MSWGGETAGLAGMPPAELDESPTSWLTRSALSQGTSPAKLLEYLGLGSPDDLEFFVHSPDMASAMKAAGLDESTLGTAAKLLANLRKVDPAGCTYLLRGERKARYRYCAVCLATQNRQYLPLHWRFKAWQWCPLHMSFMRDGCARCNAPIELPVNLAHAGRDKEGVESLAICLQCGYRLSSTAQDDRNQVDFRRLDEWTVTLLRNGRALVAAFYVGHVLLAPGGEKWPLNLLKTLKALTANDFPIARRKEILGDL